MSDDFSNDYEKRDNYDYTTDPYRDTPKKGNGCCGGCGCGCLILIIALIIGGFLIYRLCIQGAPLQVSPETTVITEPLKNDGKSVDFFQTLVEKTEPKVPVEENGFRTVLAAYGKPVFESEAGVKRPWQYEETCKKFGLDPEAAPTAAFEVPDEFLEIPENTDAAALRRKLASIPWSIDEQPKMKDWFEKVGPGLDVVRQAAMKEHYFIPMVRRNEKELCFLAVSTDALAFHAPLAQALQIRAMQRLKDGKTEDAWQDMLAALRLRRFVLAGLDFSQVEIPEDQAENMGAEDMRDMVVSLFTGTSITMDALAKHDGWTAEQLAEAVADLETMPKGADRKTNLESMQFAVLDLISSLGNMRNLMESLAETPEQAKNAKKGPMPFFHWGAVAKAMNEQFKDYETKNIDEAKVEEILAEPLEDMVKTFSKEFERNVETAISGDPVKILTVAGRSELAGMVVGQLAPFLEKLLYKEELNEIARSRVLRAALALERYKLENKNYPDSLDALKLKPLEPEIPIKYEKTGTGYTLSVGEVKIER